VVYACVLTGTHKVHIVLNTYWSLWAEYSVHAVGRERACAGDESICISEGSNDSVSLNPQEVSWLCASFGEKVRAWRRPLES
jgi:hypothetical protein